jgi:hypothetical protein
MSLVNSATEKRAQQQQQQQQHQQQQQQQMSLDPQLDMMQMGNYQQQQAFGQNGQNGFQGINMSGQGYQ